MKLKQINEDEYCSLDDFDSLIVEFKNKDRPKDPVYTTKFHVEFIWYEDREIVDCRSESTGLELHIALSFAML